MHRVIGSGNRGVSLQHRPSLPPVNPAPNCSSSSSAKHESVQSHGPRYDRSQPHIRQHKPLHNKKKGEILTGWKLHNANARIRNAGLSESLSKLMPLWDHHTSKPMRLSTDPRNTNTGFGFPETLIDAWDLSPAGVGYIAMRCEFVLQVEGEGEELDEDGKREALFVKCGIQTPDELEKWGL